MNFAITQICQHNSIIHETTVPYFSEQNKIPEHTITVFFDIVQCMLYGAQKLIYGIG